MTWSYFYYLYNSMNNSAGERVKNRIFCMDLIDASFMQQHVTEQKRGDNISGYVIREDENMVENVSVWSICH